MRQKLWKSFPNPKFVMVVVVVSLAAGLLQWGWHPQALFFLAGGALVIVLFWFRNYAPEAYEAHFGFGERGPDADYDKLRKENLDQFALMAELRNALFLLVRASPKSGSIEYMQVKNHAYEVLRKYDEAPAS